MKILCSFIVFKNWPNMSSFICKKQFYNMTNTFCVTGLRVNPTPKSPTPRVKKWKKWDKIKIMLNWKWNDCNLMCFKLLYHNPEKKQKKVLSMGKYLEFSWKIGLKFLAFHFSNCTFSKQNFSNEDIMLI